MRARGGRLNGAPDTYRRSTLLEPLKQRTRRNRETIPASFRRYGRGTMPEVLGLHLLIENFLDLADLLLYFSAHLFVRSFIFESRILRQASGLFLDLAFYFVNLSFGLVAGAVFHGKPLS